MLIDVYNKELIGDFKYNENIDSNSLTISSRPNKTPPDKISRPLTGNIIRL